MVRQKPISLVLCGCLTLTAAVPPITGQTCSQVWDIASQANFVPKVITEIIIGEDFMASTSL